MKIRTAESVSPGHPDKIADYISDYILDQILRQDPTGRCAAEVMVTGNTVLVAGEVAAKGPNLNVEELVRQAVASLGYTSSFLGFDAFSCQVASLLRQQSPDLARLQLNSPVAGDQGLVTGYATAESPDYLPLPLSIARYLLFELANLDLPGIYLDAKSLVTVGSGSDLPKLLEASISVHSSRKDLGDFFTLDKVRQEYQGFLEIPSLTKLTFNPAGPFTIGGPAGDTGLTGRKITVDQYGDEVPVGGGAFSGKDPTKVDRSAAYYARYVAKNLVAAGFCKKALVRATYLIGRNQPVTVSLDTFGTNTSKLSDQNLLDKTLKSRVFDFRVDRILDSLNLRNPIYSPTARFGHFGIEPFSRQLEVANSSREVVFYPWERLDKVDELQKALS